jgi:hypothetical protein
LPAFLQTEGKKPAFYQNLKKGKWKMENATKKQHHGGSPEDRRLRTMLEIFNKHPRGLTTLDIDLELANRGVRNMAISTTIADLRKNGLPISKAKYLGRSGLGMKIYSYRMEG